MHSTTGSSSHQPDLDWSQLRETILMLKLAVAQIEHALTEGEASVNTLAGSFTTIVNNLNDIQNSVSTLEAKDNNQQNLDGIKALIQDSSTSAMDKVQSAIMAFQFYDKLNQRLKHVSSSLSSLGDLIGDPASLYSPPKWKELQDSIRNKYTMEIEKIMFDKVLAGMPVQEALAEFLNNAATSDEDDIELF